MSAHSEARLWSGSLVTNIASPGWFLRIRMSLYGPGPERLILARITAARDADKYFQRKVTSYRAVRSNIDRKQSKDDFQLVHIVIDY